VDQSVHTKSEKHNKAQTCNEKLSNKDIQNKHNTACPQTHDQLII